MPTKAYSEEQVTGLAMLKLSTVVQEMFQAVLIAKMTVESEFHAYQKG